MTFFPNDGKIFELSPDNFDELVVQGDDFWIIDFYSTWCSSCVEFAPEYLKIADILRGVVKLGAVDIKKDKQLAHTYGIKSVPTLLIFGEDRVSPEKYNGRKTVEDIVETLLELIQNNVKKRLEKYL